MAYPPSTVAAESNTRSFHRQHAQAQQALTVLDFPSMGEYEPHHALAQSVRPYFGRLANLEALDAAAMP